MGTRDDYFNHDMHSLDEEEQDGYGDQASAIIPFSGNTMVFRSDEILGVSTSTFDQGRDEVMIVDNKVTDFKEFCTPPSKNNLNDGLLLKGVKKRDRNCVSDWVFGKLGGFSSFLRIPLDGLEDEVLQLFFIIEERRLKVVSMDAPSFGM